MPVCGSAGSGPLAAAQSDLRSEQLAPSLCIHLALQLIQGTPHFKFYTGTESNTPERLNYIILRPGDARSWPREVNVVLVNQSLARNLLESQGICNNQGLYTAHFVLLILTLNSKYLSVHLCSCFELFLSS